MIAGLPDSIALRKVGANLPWVPDRDRFPIQCAPAQLADLSQHFLGYAVAGTDPAWLISGTWLATRSATYFASPGVEVLGDGTIARLLHICAPEALLESLGESLPDVQARVAARGSLVELPAVPDRLEQDEPTRSWGDGGCSLDLVYRQVERRSAVYAFGCAMLFHRHDGGRLLIGADPGMLALVVSEDGELIDRYLADCDIAPAGNAA